MKKPTLVVLAAGMGSRFGGLKQIAPVGPNGEIIMDYSIYDAKKAGFEKVVFIIKEAIREDFMQVIGDRMSHEIEVDFAYQELTDLPEGFAVPEGRVKPWGTTHAVLAAAKLVDGPFAVINADDYYGPEAYRVLYSFLTDEQPEDGREHYAMVGYLVENTVTEHGSVARGVCEANADGYLTGIVERTNIEQTSDGARFSEDGGETWTPVAAGTLVSMNFWGFGPRFAELAARDFPAFLRENIPLNPMKCEALLPNYVGELVESGEADVKVLSSSDKWYGVTYAQDKQSVMDALQAKHDDGTYPSPLWESML